MAKPSSIPTWATGPGETIVDPGVTRTQTGFVTGKKAPASWFNYLFNRMGGWMSYLNDLHNEPEFLNKAYTWTGAHAFTAPRLYGTPVIGGTTNEILYADATGVVTPRARYVVVSLASGIAGGLGSATYNGIAHGEQWSVQAGGMVSFPVLLTRDMEITGFSVSGANVSGVNAQLTVTLVRKETDFSGGGIAVSTIGTLASGTIATATLWNVSSGLLSEVVNNALYEYELRFTVTGSGAYGLLGGLRVSVKDPGPRNG